MSIAALLHKQSLIAQRSDLELSLMQGSSQQRSLASNPNFSGLADVSRAEAGLEASRTVEEAELCAINAELESLRNTQMKGSTPQGAGLHLSCIA